MAVPEETVRKFKQLIVMMSDRDLLEKWIKVRQMGFNFEKKICYDEILWRMGYGRGGVK